MLINVGPPPPLKVWLRPWLHYILLKTSKRIILIWVSFISIKIRTLIEKLRRVVVLLTNTNQIFILQCLLVPRKQSPIDFHLGTCLDVPNRRYAHVSKWLKWRKKCSTFNCKIKEKINVEYANEARRYLILLETFISSVTRLELSESR